MGPSTPWTSPAAVPDKKGGMGCAAARAGNEPPGASAARRVIGAGGGGRGRPPGTGWGAPGPGDGRGRWGAGRWPGAPAAVQMRQRSEPEPGLLELVQGQGFGPE